MGMSLYTATGFAAGILGFAATGHAIQGLGMIPTFVLAVFLQLAAIGLLIPIRVPQREGSPLENGV